MSNLIPTSSSQVTKEWLAKVLEANGNDVKTISSLDLISNRTGWLSTAFKAKVTLGSGQVHKLFIKIMPDPSICSQEGFNDLGNADNSRELIASKRLDAAEVGFYNTAFGELVKFEVKL